MAVSVQGFTALVQNQVAAIQGACSTLLDFTVGSVLRSFVESISGVVLFLEAQALQVAALTRASTCYGADLDSYYAQFAFARLPATASIGQLTFSRFASTATAVAYLPVGTLAQTFDGSQQFAVLADATNPAYSASLTAYAIPAGTVSLTVLAQSLSVGAATNVAATTVTAITGSGAPGVNTVGNALAFEGGADAELDPAYRARFIAYLGSLSKATRTAILYVVSSIQAGLSQSLVENQTYAGTPTSGYFYDVVDDGTGNPPASLIAAASAAIDATRALGIAFSVFPPVTVAASIGMTLATAQGYTHSTVVAQVTTALVAYRQSLALGATLPYSRLAQVAYDASPGVSNVTGVTLNGGTSDLTATPQQRIVVGTDAIA